MMTTLGHSINTSIWPIALALCVTACSGQTGSNESDAGPVEYDASRELEFDAADPLDTSLTDVSHMDQGSAPEDMGRIEQDVAPSVEPDIGFRCVRDFECNDGNPCTDDLCADGVCENPTNDGTCDDDLFCNGVERCVEGECIAGELPCPSPEDCSEETGRCTACDSDEQCPDPEVVRATPCQFENICDQQGENEERVATYTCVGGECAATTEDRAAMCERDSDGIPCGGGAMCLDGACPRDPLIRVVSSGWVNFNARLFAYCQATNQSCLVQGNRNRNDRGSMDMFCELTCPAESNVQFCCSNGSVPCAPGERLAPRAGVTIDTMSAVGFTDTTCNVSPPNGQPVECLSIMGAVDARVECAFRRQ